MVKITMENIPQPSCDAQKYDAQKIQGLKGLEAARNKLNFELLKDFNIKRGEFIKFCKGLKVERSTLVRAINEAKVISFFPGIHKSKATSLSTIKIDRELKLFTKYCDVSKLEVRQLYKAVKNWRRRLEKNPKILLTNLQFDVIIGSTFGDANIRQRNKNCNFRVGHSKFQESYLKLKYNIVKEFTVSEPVWNIRKINTYIVKTLELSTATHYVFNYFRRLFYKKGIKKITREALNLLNPRSVAFWICDDGCYSKKQSYIILCTNCFSKEEHVLMKDYFNKVWGLDPTIGFRDGKYYYLRFKQEDSKKLIRIVKPFIPNSMRYKIGEENE